jgi:NAD(P)-dependent dehydrogenase (short-subunit alcohol dehydrogenase family)
MTYFVTGATGFIGRHLVQQLLDRHDGDVHVLVRPGSVARLEELTARWGHPGRVHAVIGDITLPGLGLEDAQVAALRDAGAAHLFHLAASYDMTVDDEANERMNVVGTRNVVALAGAMDASVLHHASTLAVAGLARGLFREDHFDEGQALPSAYHRTKWEAERIVREESTVPWRVYRPGIVIGHSGTGEMDKVDGPYYFFKLIQKLRHYVPEWVPLIGPELGWTNLVPVDYVVAAMDHIAHQPDLDGQAFHLTDTRGGMRSGEVINVFARAAHAPHMAMRVDRKLIDALPKGIGSLLLALPALKDVRRTLLHDLHIPEEILQHVALTCRFDTRDTERALRGSGIELPELESYAWRLWDWWERNLDPDLFKDRSLEGALNGRTVVITGASAGIGRAAALKIAAVGGIPLLVARSQDKLEAVRDEIAGRGGNAYVYPCDLTDLDAIEATVTQMLAEHASIDMLVNNAGRSIRRSVALSQDRFHDYQRTMQLNYFGAIKMIMAVLPHMRERRLGHIVNVSSIGAQTSPPRFSAYVASKAALDAWTRVVSSEVVGDGISFTTIHMPLVRTAMIAPTKMYDAFPTITAEEAGDLVCEAIRAKPKSINTRLGTFGEVAYALAPKAVDQILHTAYRVFPDSAASKGTSDPSEHASVEQIAMANLMKGVHW